MHKKSLSEKVLATIKEKKIQQKAKWTFLLRDWVVKMFGLASLLVGSLAFSVIIYMMRSNSWGEYAYVSDSFLQFFLLTLPYFWIVFLILFVLIADYNIRHTKKGYRYRLPVVVLGSILVSVVLGSLFYNIGMGQTIDNVLSKNTAYYEQFINPGFKMWHNPEKGLLSGRIISIKSENKLEFADIEGHVWLVDYNVNDCVMPGHRPVEGLQLRLFGRISEDNYFEATRIMSMGAGRGLIERKSGHFRRHIDLNFKK